MLTYLGIAVLVLYVYYCGKFGIAITTIAFVALILSIAAYFDYTFNFQDFNITQIDTDFIWDWVGSFLKNT